MRNIVSVSGRPRQALLMAAALWLVGCGVTDNPLAPYEGERPLIIQRVTQSFAPHLSWVGGRAAAVGINRGASAALDSTLVWMQRSEGETIESPVSVAGEFDRDAVLQLGGSPSDSLEHGSVYTVWVATQEAVDVGLDTNAVDEFQLVDSTFEAAYLLQGNSGGGVDVDFAVVRNQTLVSDAYIVTWTPTTAGFRQLAIREASSGGFTDLRWHVVIPEEVEAEILQPVIVGKAPEGAVVGTEWTGWGATTHTLWATTDEWDGESFGFRTPGYAFFQVFEENFE